MGTGLQKFAVIGFGEAGAILARISLRRATTW